MMGQGGQPINPYSGVSYAALMGAYGAQAQNLQANAAAARSNPYANSAAAAAYTQAAGMAGLAANPLLAQAQMPTGAHGMAGNYGAAGAAPYQMSNSSSSRSLPVHPDIKLVKLPFYDVMSELLKPASLLAQGGNRFHETRFDFYLTPSQATDIASNRDVTPGSRMDFLYQIQLRFCPLSMEPGKEASDEFPPNLNVHVNGKMVQLPNPIPTNKPGVEPKRPPKPVNITPQCKLSPILPNTIGVKWAAEYGKGWVIAISLVMKLTSDDLLDRLKKKGTREPTYTKNLIKEKLNNDDDDVATDSLKVTLTCPLGKMRMRVPCRPVSCNHMQCFDASTFLQMNERKPTWNCPVCDKKALYDDLMIDGYFQEILDSKETVGEENVMLERDGSWKLAPKEEDASAAKEQAAKPAAAGKEKEKEAPPGEEGSAPAAASATNGNSKKSTAGEKEKEGGGPGGDDCITLSDDEEESFAPAAPPPLPAAAPPPQPPPPPQTPAEIECIDLD